MYKEIYQKLYTTSRYGWADKGCCPGVRYFPKYEAWLLNPIIDLGCGSGDTVKLLRKEGFDADGIDQIELKNGMISGDICDPMKGIEKYKTAISIDVFEHLTNEKLRGLLSNMAQCRRQVLNIFLGPSTWPGTNFDLHINQQGWPEWEALIQEYLRIIHSEVNDRCRRLFFCESLHSW